MKYVQSGLAGQRQGGGVEYIWSLSADEADVERSLDLRGLRHAHGLRHT